MCLGGHLAYRCALDERVAAAVCYFATDIHSHSLGEGMKDDSLERSGEIHGELIMVSALSFADSVMTRNSRLILDRVYRSLGRRLIMSRLKEEI